MKVAYALIFIFFSVFAFAQQDSIIYPPAPKADIKDTIWGTAVNDPYRTLETDNPERQEWLNQEEQITKAYFKKNKEIN